MCRQRGGGQDHAGFLMPEAFLDHRPHAQRRGIERKTLAAWVDLDPVDQSLVRLADHAGQIVIGFIQAAVDITNIADHIFQIIVPIRIDIRGGFVDLCDQIQQQVQRAAGLIPFDLNLGPLGDGARGGQYACLP